MNLNILFFIFFKIIIINDILTTSYSIDVDLKKYKKITVTKSPSGPYYERYIIFDSSDFKKGDKIYFKITMTLFTYEYIYYKFFDDLNNYQPIPEDTDSVAPTQTDNYNENEITNYYTIEKNDRNLGSLEGKYLAIFFYGYGNALIENIEEDVGSYTLIAIIVIVIIIIIGAIIFLIYYCIKRKRRLAQYNLNNGNQNIYNYNYSNSNNYIQQQSQINPNDYAQQQARINQKQQQPQINPNNYVQQQPQINPNNHAQQQPQINPNNHAQQQPQIIPNNHSQQQPQIIPNNHAQQQLQINQNNFDQQQPQINQNNLDQQHSQAYTYNGNTNEAITYKRDNDIAYNSKQIVQNSSQNDNDNAESVRNLAAPDVAFSSK